MFHDALRRTALTCLAVPPLALSLAAQQACSQPHPKGPERLHQVAKDGDVAVVKGIAGHTVRNSVQHYGIADIVSEDDKTRAANQMYDFLKWKLGSPSLVAAQYVTAGYEHFEKSYRDEAGAMMLGVLDFAAQEPELKVPEFLLAWVNAKVGQSSEAVIVFLGSHGIPEMLARPLGELVEKALQNLVERNKVGVYVPKSYDVDNDLVRTAIEARRAVAAGLVTIPWTRGAGSGPGGGRTGPTTDRPVRETGTIGLPPVHLPDTPPAEAPATGDGGFAGRLADLEARVARLESLLEQAVGMIAEGAVADAALAPVAGGYDSVVFRCKTWGTGRCRLSVNGLQVVVCDDEQRLDLGPFLVAGRRNEVAIEVEPLGQADVSSVEVSLSGTVKGSEQAIEFYRYRGAKDRLTDSVEVAIAPGS